MADITHGTWIKDGKAVDAVYQSSVKVYGRNLVLGTATPFTIIGSHTIYMYHLSSTIAKGTTATMSFDTTSTNSTGEFSVQIISAGGSFESTDWYPIDTVTHHYSYTFVTDNEYSNGVQIWTYSSTGTLTVSNFIISESSKEVPWNQAPEDKLN